jgi:predicted nucleic acid-binding Zn finger protein
MQKIKVQSETNKDQSYVLSKIEGEWHCTCPAFVYHGISPCKHIEAYLNKKKENKNYTLRRVG